MAFDLILAELAERTGQGPATGVSVVSVSALLRRPVDPTMALVIIPGELAGPGAADAPEPPSPADPEAPPFRPALLAGRHGHGDDPAELLRRLYPAEHPVLGLAGAGDTTVGALTTAELASGPHGIAAIADLRSPATPWGLPWLVARLRAPGGCPWDREQDHASLRPFLLEEAYEVYDALERGATPDLAEELGDLWLQIVLHAQHAAEAGVFDLSDVERSIMAKIVRRHPHVFGDGAARTADDVTRAWEDIKADERAAAGTGGDTRSPDMPAAFEGLSRSLPALAYANEMQARAASLGYDWPDLEGVIDKVAEEATELLGADGPEHRAEEYGDLLFVLVNLARKMDIDPEAALRAASRKFARRFAGVERIAGHRQLQLKALGLDELDELWQEVKREEAAREERAASGEGVA
ncbi:MAG: nucleoside triphosphate pyrophosphohydrolase [Candidatus Limnocylindrales bacterium]